MAGLGLEVLDHDAVEKDVHALLVGQHGACGGALAQHQLAGRDVGAAQRRVPHDPVYLQGQHQTASEAKEAGLHTGRRQL
jgi:hypothetical protein